MKFDKNSDTVTLGATWWLKLKLSDDDDVEYLWDNYIHAGLAEHISREEFDALVPQVREALIHQQSLPAMSEDTRDAFSGYLASFDHEVFVSEYANIAENGEWAHAIQEAYIRLRTPLHE